MSNRESQNILEEIKSADRYVCSGVKTLDRPLSDGLKGKFRDLFSDVDVSWRMHYKSNSPQTVLARMGIDYDNPTVRDAVAFDLVKLDDPSVSNTYHYTYPERRTMSPMELERFLLNRNFRINLLNLEPEWSKLPYGKEDDDRYTKVVRTVEKVY